MRGLSRARAALPGELGGAPVCAAQDVIAPSIGHAHQLSQQQYLAPGPQGLAAEVFPSLIEPLPGSLRRLGRGIHVGLQIDRAARIENNADVTTHVVSWSVAGQ